MVLGGSALRLPAYDQTLSCKAILCPISRPKRGDSSELEGPPERSGSSSGGGGAPLPALLACAAEAAAREAPIRHRMWRTLLVEQLRAMRAACEVRTGA
jgi:hypothetical protein